LKYKSSNPPTQPVDYLAIGHITQDITSSGMKPGGTVSFSGLTALAFGLKVGIVTSIPDQMETSHFGQIDLAINPTGSASTFENIQTPDGRIQVLHDKASDILEGDIPEAWKKTPIVHLGPVCQEIVPEIIHFFPDSFIGVTPQGWLRTWDETGLIGHGGWPNADLILEKASAVILSLEDVHNNESWIEEWIPKSRVFVVTEGIHGARVYWNGDLRFFKAPEVETVDPTGAGDIFAAVFFIRMVQTKDPWEAARCAVRIASTSVTRERLDGIPTHEEIQSILTEILPG
jgi:sugar/nucleoside kinase (ribokinase family)